MKKVLKIEMIMDNPILLLNDRSIHILIYEPIPITQLVVITNFYVKRNYVDLDYSKISELDFSRLKGFNQEIYQLIKNRIEIPDVEK